MDLLKWLKRKYPDSHNEICGVFDENQLRDAKRLGRRFGRLPVDVVYGTGYKAGSLCVWWRNKCCDDNGVWNGEFTTYCIVKCEPGYTQSGYHSFMAFCEIDEIKS